MADYRRELYKRYVSGFKAEARQKSTVGDAAFFGYCDRKFRRIFDAIPRGGAILEAGCGDGRMIRYLRSLGFSNMMGVDVSEEQAELARSAGVNAIAVDIFDFLRSSEQVWDAVVALDFVEHFTKDELMTLLPAIAGAMRDGGALILLTPNGEGLFPRQVIYGDLTHSTIFTPSSLEQILRIAGFDGFQFFETGPAPGSARRALRIALWNCIKAAANTVRMIEAGKRQDIWTETMICACSKRATAQT